jgi:hypothetical protein
VSWAALLLSRSGRKRCSRLLRRIGLPQEGRETCGQNEGEKINEAAEPYELERLTRNQLLALLRQIASALPELPEGSRERQIALTNLQRIRLKLWMPAMTCQP